MTNSIAIEVAGYIQQQRSQKQADERLRRFEDMIGKMIVLWGPKRTGKTSSMVYLGHNLQKLTGYHVVVVGTLVGLNEKFGESTFLAAEDFVCQMRTVSQLAPTLEGLPEDEIELRLLEARSCTNPEHDPEFILLANNQWVKEDIASKKAAENAIGRGEQCWTAANGVIIYRAIIMIDEGNEFMGGDVQMNPLVRLFALFVQRMAHLKLTIIAAAPRKADIAPKMAMQVDSFARCNTFKGKGYTKIAFRDGLMQDRWTLKFLYARYWEMYESFNLLGIRGRNLSIAKKFI